MAFVNEKENKRTIDHERNVYLVHKSTRSSKDEGSSAIFEIYWNDKKFIFHMDENIQKQKNDKALVSWKITHIFSAKNIEVNQKELQDLIQEALQAYGYLYQWKDISKVDIKFSNALSWQDI